MLHELDIAISHFFNHFARHSKLFDECVVFLSNCQILKGGALMTMVWWVWFKQKESARQNREHLITTFAGTFSAMFAARVFAHLLPFRNRPILEVSNHLVEAFSLDKSDFNTLNSFPSDHATMFYSLSVGLLFSSKKTGITAIIYTTLFIAFPRIYLGLHYATDIIGGAIIGIIIVLIANTQWMQVKFARPFLDRFQYKHHLLYPGLFLISYQIADMFTSSRNLVLFAIKHLH